VNVYGVQVNNFRPPQNVRVHPQPESEFVFEVDDMDISVSGQLNGKVEILAPIAIRGLAHVQLQRVTITKNS
jgi:hypothetical protein